MQLEYLNHRVFLCIFVALGKIVFLTGRSEIRFMNLVYYPGSHQLSGRESDRASKRKEVCFIAANGHS